MSGLSVVFNAQSGERGGVTPYDHGVVDEVYAFHKGIDGYEATPLWPLRDLANRLGIEAVWVKDESFRFGLNAFKSLGASYVIGSILADRFGLPVDETTWLTLRESGYREPLEQCTFVTATDGNHGRGVAWAAAQLGAKARVLMPKGTVDERVRAIADFGADVEVTGVGYDETVERAAALAAEHGWTLVQDTAWPGYEAVPLSIMKGYTTIGREIADQLAAAGERPPTHIFLQAGVGSFAAALAAYATSLWTEPVPKIIIVEPTAADCFYQTAAADDGRLHPAAGAMDSMMAGLCCGVPSPLAWEVLRTQATAFVACDDGYAARGMVQLAYPFGDDPAMVSGESGAVTCGVLRGLREDPALVDVSERLALDESARVLLISTEGATDSANYDRIVG